MQKDQQFCYKHPETLTFRKCYSCYISICTECQITKSHHIFCSLNCWQNFLFTKATSPIIQSFQRIKILHSPWIGVAILTILVGWLILINRQLSDEIKSIKLTLENSNSIVDGFLDQYHKLKITEPVETKGMIYYKTINIIGEAEENSVVMLLSGDELIQVVKPEDGKFFFEQVKLTRRHKVFSIQMMSMDGQRVALETMDFRYNTPSLKYLTQTLSRGNKQSPQIALTFDGGSLNNMSEEILNALKEYNVKTTFFLTGEFINDYPETVLRITSEGHEVGNHTMSHPHLTTYGENKKHITRPEITKESFQEELIKTEVAFSSLTGMDLVPFWRAPFGEQNREIREWAAELGYKHVSWTQGDGIGNSMDTKDWIADTSNPNYNSADQISSKILNFADTQKHGANGSIILMHMGSERKDDYPQKKLTDIITGLKDRGYQLITVSKLTSI